MDTYWIPAFAGMTEIAETSSSNPKKVLVVSLTRKAEQLRCCPPKNLRLVLS